MSYRDYVIAAYVVFALMLLWDWLAPKLAIRRALRAALQLSRRRVYVPDLVFLSQSQLDRYSSDRGRIVGAPDLVVEIVSPASASRDRVAKFNAYREAGVPWYWLIDSQFLVVEEYRLMPEGYLAVARVAAGEIFRPQLFPDLGVNLAELMGEAGSAEIEAQESDESAA